jgi:hypothetical protein
MEEAYKLATLSRTLVTEHAAEALDARTESRARLDTRLPPRARPIYTLMARRALPQPGITAVRATQRLLGPVGNTQCAGAPCRRRECLALGYRDVI